MPALSRPLYERLVGAKFIFRNGVEILGKGGPFSVGLAVLAFQDSAEMVLRVIAEHLHVSLRPTVAFNKIIDSIDDAGPLNLSHRSALNQLNNSRVGFKHFGNEPNLQDALKFRADLEGFFTNASADFLNLDFASLSLADLVSGRRIATNLKEAESALQQQRLEDSVRASAVAFSASMHRFKLPRERMRLQETASGPAGGHTGNGVPREVVEVAEQVEDLFEGVYEELDAVTFGLSLAEYRRFLDLTPVINLSADGTAYLGRRPRQPPNRGQSLFCLRFATDSALKMQSYGSPRQRPYYQKSTGVQVRVKQTSPVWLHPDPDTSEKIWDAVVGEEFEEAELGNSVDGYRALLVDDLIGFIKDGCVEELEQPQNPGTPA